MIYFDTETCGLHGPIVLLQWARNDGPINLHSVWTEPIQSTLDLIDEICYEEDGIVGFNLAFDWFHICQLYTTLTLLKEKVGGDAYPEDNVEDYAILEPLARDGLCIKPMNACDIMLHARKGPYQTLMDREDITLKRVPTQLAYGIAAELTQRIPLPDVYFARKKENKAERWQVVDIFDDFGDAIPELKNIVLRFAPSSALKALAVDALKIPADDILLYADLELPDKAYPFEIGYAPYALAPYYEADKFGIRRIKQPSPENWMNKWPEKIRMHIQHWGYNPIARTYAEKDVVYTRDLYKYFGSPALGDDDSVLACMVGAVRWRGFKLEIDKVERLKAQCELDLADMTSKINYNNPDICKRYLAEVLSETEQLVMKVNGKITTKGIILEEIAKWFEEITCDECKGMGCAVCGDGLLKSDRKHPAAIRAQEILDARHAKKEIELYEKLLLAGRFHASFVVIGTLSSRMSGADGLNPQGIKRSKEVRACFSLAWDGLRLNSGDFDGFEVCLADAVYADPDLRADLLSGKSLHGLFGTFLFPPMTYEEIQKTKGLPNEKDKYTRSKNGVFAMLYGGEAYTLSTRVGVDEKVADEAYQRWCSRYKVWGQERRKYFDMFCSMRQPGGIGTKVEWHDPADYIESIFGFRRYFTLENRICKVLFELAQNPPKHWKLIKATVTRRERVQSVCGASQSALYAASFALQAANMRAAANHVIQSSGATLTKNLQRRMWDIQPSGIAHWRVQPMNIHDEVACPSLPDYQNQLTQIVDDFLVEFRPKVPLIAMKWKSNLKSWADK